MAFLEIHGIRIQHLLASYAVTLLFLQNEKPSTGVRVHSSGHPREPRVDLAKKPYKFGSFPKYLLPRDMMRGLAA